MKRQVIPRSFGTHDGAFHADEVTACALLSLFNRIDRDKVIRTRDPEKLNRCEYVCDVGGFYDPDEKLFDHHQVEYKGPMASAGMILKYLRETKVIDSKEYDTFNNLLILGVDAHDNGQDPQIPGLCTFSHLISNFAPISREADPEEWNESFNAAVDFTVGHLTRLRDRYRYIIECRSAVEAAMKGVNDCLIFDRNIAWMESFFELGGEQHPASFIVMPSGDHWKLRGIPPNLHDKMSVRVPLPKEWAGLLEDDLKKASGIPGAVFCHKGRFISVWETKEDALKAMQYVVAKYGTRKAQ